MVGSLSKPSAPSSGVPDFTASLINESNVSAENVSAKCRAADFSPPADPMALVTNHSFCPPERRSDDGPPRTYTDGMTRPSGWPGCDADAAGLSGKSADNLCAATGFAEGAFAMKFKCRMR
uniref:Uncharacterized protein n=1 Tax=Mycolicibacterium gilvum (strain PYR-GCK) TaxID=350054 RepID=A4TBA9_MYCGI|nr:hypothetical protein Mflv_3022 [Mycolicibacterium gilvum PYR-GCK]